ncbi:hypothetical protein ACFSKI_19110 [Pseudogracilibacillus auburnensis]|uniref:Uncharacterized protein n=1 Tax=Pseudogracilibacillus auburnensis TaxID=1494959 RepID=A0A2V3W531_9BACI|nr:hypothetical protein [Pseudogracilibacillus auburnensis]PXW88806.1 hypothetical protein DFR56_103312 [Pseudogracilibacillus auburnensis]
MRSNGDKPSFKGAEEKKGVQPKPKSIGTLTVDIDCSDALKGLKAVQREARKATAALKELEVKQNNMGLPIRMEGSS